MRHHRFIAAGLAAAVVGVAGCGGGGSESGNQPDTLTVWLMPEAKENWPKAVKTANKTFEKQHPGVKVQVREQDWAQYLTKFEAQLGGGKPPDVLEIGNTQTMKYMASGALVELTQQKGSFDNSGSWLTGLKDSCTYKGKLYCVPYYAATRGIIYRKDMFKKAGVDGEPKSLAKFTKAAGKLMDQYGDKSNFSAYYFPGKYWYAAMAYVYDYGGQIAARKNGKWEGTLDSPEARKGLKKLKEIVSKYSRASKTGDEENRAQPYAAGNVAMLYGVSYDVGVITNPEEGGNADLKGKLGAFPMPSHVPGEIMPAFLGGSNLAVPAGTDAPKLAMDWIRAFTSNKAMTMMAKNSKMLPNTTSLLKYSGDDPISKAFAKAATKTWFVPTAKNWSTVEQRNVIPTMLVNIFTGRASVEQATAKASKKITEILNAS